MKPTDTRSPAEWRRAKISQIHVAKAQLGLDDDSYRDLLARVAGVRSAAKLDKAGITAMLAELQRKGFKPKRTGGRQRSTPAGNREALIGKVKALLSSVERPDRYADAMAQRMFQVDRYEWCAVDQLQKLVAALAIDARRQGREA